MRVPSEATIGSARVTLSFDDCADLDIGPAIFELPVAAPPAKKK